MRNVAEGLLVVATTIRRAGEPERMTERHACHRRDDLSSSRAPVHHNRATTARVL
jgi:hypothetical protein